MVSPGGTTTVHGIEMPNEFDNWVDAYEQLLEEVDVGLMIVVEQESELSAYEGGSHSDVPALVTDEGKLLVSDGGTFSEEIELGADFSSLDSDDVDDLANALEDEFLELSGGTMEGDINMNGNNVENAGDVDADKVEADKLILPTT